MKSDHQIKRLLLGIFFVVISIALILLGYMFSTIRTTIPSIGAVYIGIFLLFLGTIVGIGGIINWREKK